MSVTLHTSHGNLKFELFCEDCPKAATNFLALCACGAYNGVAFHRNEPHFLLQAGLIDETKFPLLVRSMYGVPFADEISPLWRHDSRGVLSMANRNVPNSNETQFMVMYAARRELDGTSTVMGRCVGGWDVLDRVEQQGPKGETCTILTVTIHANPMAA